MKNLSTPSSVKLFNVPISIINKPQALALIGGWLRKWRGEVGSGKLDNEVRNEKSHFSLRSAATPASHIHHRTSGYPKIITTPNPEIIVSAQSDPELMEALQEADLSIPDGIGVVWALKLLWKGKSGLGREAGMDSEGEGESEIFSLYPYLLPFRLPNPNLLSIRALSGLDLMESLISELPRTLLQGLSSKESPWKVMLLGGRPGVAKKVKRHCEARRRRAVAISSGSFAPLRMTALSGPQDISTISKSENSRLIAQINSFQPDLLFVAFGHPKQEKWLIANRESLTVGVAMAVGGALDQIADPSLRPPAYINSIGLGWLYRLLRQPWRIKRQLALIKFVGMAVKELLS